MNEPNFEFYVRYLFCNFNLCYPLFCNTVGGSFLKLQKKEKMVSTIKITKIERAENIFFAKMVVNIPVTFMLSSTNAFNLDE